MKEEVVGVDYISLTGVKSKRSRDKNFTTLNPCYFRFVKLVASQDTAYHLRRYMAANMILGTDKGITFE